jgi:hypothetical protein
VPASIYIIHDAEESSVRALAFQLSERLSSVSQPTPIRSAFFHRNITSIKSNDIMVAIGVESFHQVCSTAKNGVVIAIFIGQEEYSKIQQTCLIPSSGVFSGAPLDRRLAILEAVWLDRKPLAVLYSDDLLIDKGAMKNTAAEYGFELQFLKTNTDRLSVLKSVNFVLEESEVILSLVDTKLYQNGIAQDILKLLFHKQQIMIGSSLAFVRAGSLFAIHSDSGSKLVALVDRIQAWNDGGVLIEAGYPDVLRVSFNPYLIRSHGVVLPSASYLKDKYGLCSETQC